MGISYLAELERMGFPVVPGDEEWVKTRCPFHEDQTPSCSLNTKSGGFKCHACGAHGDFVKFMARATGSNRATIGAHLAKTYDLEADKTIEVATIEKMHAQVWEAKHLLRELYDRGVTDDDLRRYRIGFHAHTGRIAIPVKNEAGAYVNVRYYLPGAKGADKMKNARGRGKMRLYPIEQLSHKWVVVCGGEVKSIVAARACNEHECGAICASGGEGNWDPAFTLAMRGKERAYVMLDVDETGRKAALIRAAQLATVVPWVGIVELPLDRDKYPRGDNNDFQGREGGDLWKLILATPQWVPPTRVADPDEEPAQMSFSETVQSRNVGKRMRFNGVIAASSERSFVVPKRVVVTCSKDQDCCAQCAVHPSDQKVFHVSPESPAILQMVHATDQAMDLATRNALGVPKKCGAVTFEVTDHFNVEDVLVNPSLEITNRDSDKTMQQAVCVQCDASLNSTYEFVGRMYPHPRSQQATLVIAQSAATHDALERYEPKELHKLRVFRPEEWSLAALEARLDDIYSDLESNVTRVFLRRDVHLFVDLACHSCLLINVDGKLTKGWTDVLIMGDSSQGKSEVALTLSAHYRLGEKFDCKNASPAGILGGAAKVGEQWYVQWGVIPTHDKRWVIMEEAKGLPTEMIAALTDARSSGRAEITKITKRRTFARTRLTWLSNARNDRTMATYNFGVEAIRDLIGAPEDVRRFDAALIVSSGEVDPKEINRLVRDPPPVRHRYTSDLCNALLLWAWTRRDSDIVVEPDAAALVSDEAGRMADEYSDQIPLVDKGSTRQKLTRLAAAVASRTFSTGDTELQLRIRRCHVEFIVSTLKRIYDSKTFGYRFFSEAERATAEMADGSQIAAKLEMLPHGDEAQRQMLYSDLLDIVDVQDWFGWDRTAAAEFLSLLVRKRAVRRLGSGNKYAKTPQFIQWLKDLKLEPRPDHIKEKF